MTDATAVITATTLASIGVFVLGIVASLISLIAWSAARKTLSRSRQRSEETIVSRIGHTQTADLLDEESAGDARLTEAMTSLIESLSDTEQAVLQVGDILLVKDSGRVLTRQLTLRQQRYLERHPELLKSPSAIIHALQDPTNPLGRHSAKSLSSTVDAQFLSVDIARRLDQITVRFGWHAGLS